MKYKKLYDILEKYEIEQLVVPGVGIFLFGATFSRTGEYYKFEDWDCVKENVYAESFGELITKVEEFFRKEYKEEFTKLFERFTERYGEGEMKEYKIGEKFIWEGKEWITVEEREDCLGCYLNFDPNPECEGILCAGKEREDGKGVIFIESEIRTIRTFKELAGLSNGKGLYLEKGLLHNSKKIFLKFKGEPQQSFELESTEIEDVALLKAMGFEFEWKPKLPEEEVLAKYETVEFNYNSVNYTVTKNQDDSYVPRNITIHYLGAKYYTEKDMIAICKELNS